jgi:HSP20 family protein
MSSQSNPFRELERVFDRMSEQFDAARNWGSESPLGEWGASGDPAVDLTDSGSEYEVTVDVPGFDRSEIDVHLSDHTLSITASHDDTTDESEENYLRRERSHRSLRRTVRLPEAANTETVSARLRNGVLIVTIAKQEPSESARTVEIEAE